jgi:hypothetical protein
MKRYLGSFTGTGPDTKPTVVVEEPGSTTELRSRSDLRGYRTSVGFAWGYMGAGPNDLAISLLADVLGDDATRQWYKRFLEERIATLDDEDDWAMTDEDIRQWFKSIVDTVPHRRADA